MIIRNLSSYIKDYGLHAAAVRAADRLLKRRAEEVSYDRWLQRSRKSSRDYTRMAKEKFAWNPVIAVKAFMNREDRTPFMQSVNLQICRNVRPFRKCQDPDYILIVGTGCILAPDLLWQAVNMLNDEGLTKSVLKDAPALIYFDSDRIGSDGRKTDPAFRPEYDPDLLESVNYMGEVVLVRADLALEAGLPSDDASGLHKFLKKICASAHEQPGREGLGAVRHIPQILYHEITDAESEETSSLMRDMTAGSGAPGSGTARRKEPLVSVLIPNKDHAQDLEKCIESLQKVNSWQNLEILILENNSEDPETFACYDRLCGTDDRIRVLKYGKPFNYSAVNNFGAEHAEGEYLLLLNNDTVILKEDSIARLVELVSREDTGAAGALLYYPDGSIQHAGIILGHGGIAGHAFAGERSGRDLGSFPGLVYDHTHNVSAVTGACLMVSRKVWQEAGGMDEDLAVAFNDVDFCMRLRRHGLKILLCPQAQLIHNESVSRGAEDSPEKVARFHREIGIMASRWEAELEAGDPFYNPNLTLTGRSWTCRDELREKAKPYLKYLHSMAEVTKP